MDPHDAIELVKSIGLEVATMGGCTVELDDENEIDFSPQECMAVGFGMRLAAQNIERHEEFSPIDESDISDFLQCAKVVTMHAFAVNVVGDAYGEA